MKVAVCDDERGVREYLSDKIRAFDENLEVSSYSDGDSLLDEGYDADIIFLDVQMPDMDGMETAVKLRDRGSHAVIIFVSAEKEHVFKAFDVGAFNYLVKPFDKVRFYEILTKAVKQAKDNKKDKPDNEMTERKPSDRLKAMVVKSGNAHMRVLLDDIEYAEVTNRKVTLHTFDGNIEYYGKLMELINITGDDFVRPHRAFLVNMKHIKSYDSENVYLSKESVPIARGRHSEFVKAYLRYNAQKISHG